MYKDHIKIKRKVWKVGKTGQKLVCIPKSCSIEAGDSILIVKKMIRGKK